MSVATLENPMAKKRAVKREDVSIKVDVKVYQDAKAVASMLGVGLAEYISESLKKVVERDLVEQLKKRLGAQKSDNPSK